jgi:hypothetical protein
MPTILGNDIFCVVSDSHYLLHTQFTQCIGSLILLQPLIKLTVHDMLIPFLNFCTRMMHYTSELRTVVFVSEKVKLYFCRSAELAEHQSFFYVDQRHKYEENFLLEFTEVSQS